MAFTSLKSVKEILEQCVKYVQRYQMRHQTIFDKNDLRSYRMYQRLETFSIYYDVSVTYVIITRIVFIFYILKKLSCSILNSGVVTERCPLKKEKKLEKCL